MNAREKEVTVWENKKDKANLYSDTRKVGFRVMKHETKFIKRLSMVKTLGVVLVVALAMVLTGVPHLFAAYLTLALVTASI